MKLHNYTLPIYPDGIGWGKKDYARLHFDSAEQKEAYITAEYKFTVEERNAYFIVVGEEAREKQHRLMLAKRAQFAIQNGFVPNRSKKTWTIEVKKDELA